LRFTRFTFSPIKPPLLLLDYAARPPLQEQYA
jgi:hypothetical protein